MSTFTIIILSAITNVLLILTCLSLYMPRIKEYIRKRKIRKENLSKLERATFVKEVRAEVRRYLKELQDDN